MDIDPDLLEDKSTRDILHHLVNEVTKSEEKVEEKETRSGKQPVVKIFVSDNKGIEPGKLHRSIEEYVRSKDIHKHERDFFNNKVVNEENFNETFSLVEISSPSVNRTDEYILVFKDGYVWVLTTVVRKWTKRTIEKVLDYLPEVERLYISSEDLEDLVGGINELGETSVSGFTAEYRSPYRERDATLRFHGAEPEDLETAKREFQATPSRIEFNQANSPVAAIQDSISNDGLITVESVKENSEEQAVETALHILEGYEDRYKESFGVSQSPAREILDRGFKVEGFTAIELNDPEIRDSDTLFKKLEQDILSKNQYDYGKWGDDAFYVFDKHHKEIIEVAVEPPDLVLYARESTSALSLRTFYNHIYEEFNSTYNVDKYDAKVS